MSEFYPGLDVTDNVATTSITVKGTGLALWAFTGRLGAGEGFQHVVTDYGLPASFSEEEYYTFLHHLLECRGEFARLLCILANVEREESDAEDEDWSWWETDRKNRVIEQLKRCVVALEQHGNPWGGEQTREFWTRTDRGE